MEGRRAVRESEVEGEGRNEEWKQEGGRDGGMLRGQHREKESGGAVSPSVGLRFIQPASQHQPASYHTHHQ